LTTVLRNLKVNEGSLVDSPANPKARVLFFKRGGEKTVSMKTEDGHDYPPEAYAYVPDPEKPSTWKLRLWEDPEKKETANQTGMAADALGPGLFGNPAKIPEKDLPAVKAKVLAAWKKTHQDEKDDDIPEQLKKSKISFGKRLVSTIRKSWFAGEGWDWDGTSSQTTAHDFTAGLKNDDYSDALLSTASAMLADSIDSILDDPTVTDKKSCVAEAIQQYEQFLDSVGLLQSASSINKSGRKISSDRMSQLKDLHQKLGDLIAGANTGGNEPEGDEENMDIDKSKLSPEVVKYLEGIEKRAKDAESKVEELTKSAGGNPGPEDIWKGVPTAVRERVEKAEQRAKEAEEVAKRERDERETREFVAKAKAFRGLPVQADEFGSVLKSIKSANPEVYEKLEGVLKSADELIVKGGVFKEIGGSGVRTGSAADQIEQFAKAKVEASGGKLTIQKARSEVRKENRDLAQREREEAND
jgi:hypothetical protein